MPRFLAFLFMLLAAALGSLSLGTTPAAGQSRPSPTPAPHVDGCPIQIMQGNAPVQPMLRAAPPPPRIIPQRLQVIYDGQDGYTLIGSGCPGDAGRGVLVDHHFRVRGVNPLRQVTRILVTGDTSTLTWEWPCSSTIWGLYALDRGDGQWDIFVAPSERAAIYTVLFFYEDDSFALGMVSVP